MNWPEKINHDGPIGMNFKDGWNSCHNAFMKIINNYPSFSEGLAYECGYEAGKADSMIEPWVPFEAEVKSQGGQVHDMPSGLEGGQCPNCMGIINGEGYGKCLCNVKPEQGQGLDRAIIGIDREAAEQIANEIWEQCATKGAIADYIQARFPPYTIPVSEPDIQKPALEPLNVKDLTDWILTSDWDNVSSPEIARQLCAKFGTPPRAVITLNKLKEIITNSPIRYDVIIGGGYNNASMNKISSESVETMAKTIFDSLGAPLNMISVEDIAEIIYEQSAWKESLTYVSDFGALHQDTQDRFLKIAKAVIQALTKDTK